MESTYTGTYLRTARLKRNKSQIELAAKLGYTSQFLANWERGASLPPAENLKEIAKVYKVGVCALRDELLRDYKKHLNKVLGL